MKRKIICMLITLAFVLCVGCGKRETSCMETECLSENSVKDAVTKQEETSSYRTITEKNEIPYDNEKTVRNIRFSGDMMVVLYADWSFDCYMYNCENSTFETTDDYKTFAPFNGEKRIVYYKDKKENRLYGYAFGNEDELITGDASTDIAFLIIENSSMYKINFLDGTMNNLLDKLDINKETSAKYVFTENAKRAVVITSPSTDDDLNVYSYLDTDTGVISNLEELTGIHLFDKKSNISTELSFTDNNNLVFVTSNHSDNKSVLYTYSFITNKTTIIKEFEDTFSGFKAGGDYYIMVSDKNSNIICINNKTLEVLWEEDNVSPYGVVFSDEKNYIDICVNGMDNKKQYWTFNTLNGEHSSVESLQENILSDGSHVTTTQDYEKCIIKCNITK